MEFTYGEERCASLNLSTGEVREIIGRNPDGSKIYGRTFPSRCRWNETVYKERKAALQKLKARRDPASDLENLPGIKGEFVDDWFDLGPQFIQTEGCTPGIIMRPPLVEDDTTS